MAHFCRMPMILLLAAALLVPVPSQAMLIPRPDLTTLCFLGTDVVEARLTRQHIPGQDEWKDTLIATVVNPLEGNYKAGDKISYLDFTLYDPARTGQRCLLFLARRQENLNGRGKPPQPELEDMRLIDHQGRVRRYFQWMDPGGLVAEDFILTEHSPTKLKPVRVNGVLVANYQGNNTFEESDTAEQKFRPLAEERSLIAARWAIAKKRKPLY